MNVVPTLTPLAESKANFFFSVFKSAKLQKLQHKLAACAGIGIITSVQAEGFSSKSLLIVVRSDLFYFVQCIDVPLYWKISFFGVMHPEIGRQSRQVQLIAIKIGCLV